MHARNRSVAGIAIAIALACSVALALPLAASASDALSAGETAAGANAIVAETMNASPDASVVKTVVHHAKKRVAKRTPFKRTLKDGVYSFRTRLARSGYSIGLARQSAASGVGMRLLPDSSSLYQRFSVKRLKRDGAYSIQVANSGKYLTASHGKVVQRPRRAKELPASQRWRIRKVGASVAFVNMKSGKCLAVAGGRAKANASIEVSRFSKKRSQLFRPVRVSQLIDAGYYTLDSSAAQLRLEVRDGSWSNGAKLQAAIRNGGGAQCFRVQPAGKGFYRITMAIAGSTLSVIDAERHRSASATMSTSWKRSSSQLWRARVGDNGIVFTNKATGGALAVRGKHPQAGASVGTTARSAAKSPGWRLSATGAQIDAPGNLAALVQNATGDSSRAVRLDARGTDFALDADSVQRLSSALGEAWSRHEEIGFVMVDLATGITLTSGANRSNHGASTFKAAYVTYLFQELIEKGRVSYGSVASLISATIGYSSNEAYLSLRGRFGSAGFKSWLDTVGLGHLAQNPYPRLTARSLALVWTKIYSYQNSGGRFVGTWKSTFNHSYFSFIHEQLAGSNTVYSKPGWYPKTGGLDALNDAAIVKSRNGKGSYLVAIVSSTSCYTERWIMRNLAKQLDAVHAKMPRTLADG